MNEERSSSLGKRTHQKQYRYLDNEEEVERALYQKILANKNYHSPYR